MTMPPTQELHRQVNCPTHEDLSLIHNDLLDLEHQITKLKLFPGVITHVRLLINSVTTPSSELMVRINKRTLYIDAEQSTNPEHQPLTLCEQRPEGYAKIDATGSIQIILTYIQSIIAMESI
jgi:hypothetical protein